MSRSSLFVFVSFAISACGGAAQPTPETPKPYETRSAVTSIEAAPTGEALKAAQATKAEAGAKTLAWTDRPTLESAPQGSAFGTIGDAPFAITDVELQVSEATGTWTFRARGGASGILGPSITMKGAPAAGQVTNAEMGANAGYFQAPRLGRDLTTKDFAETVDLQTENAYRIEITKLSMSADGKTGAASGRFVTMFKDAGADLPAMRAAGTFSDAPVRIWKK